MYLVIIQLQQFITINRFATENTADKSTKIVGLFFIPLLVLSLSYVKKNRVLTETKQFVLSLRAGPRLIRPRSHTGILNKHYPNNKPESHQFLHNFVLKSTCTFPLVIAPVLYFQLANVLNIHALKSPPWFVICR